MESLMNNLEKSGLTLLRGWKMKAKDRTGTGYTYPISRGSREVTRRVSQLLRTGNKVRIK